MLLLLVASILYMFVFFHLPKLKQISFQKTPKNRTAGKEETLQMEEIFNGTRPWISYKRLNSLPSCERALDLSRKASTVYGMQMGINYLCNKKKSLKGCINDAINFRALLLANTVPEDNLLLFTDFTETQPTKSNVLHAIGNLLSKVPDGGTVMITFSGHGVKTADGETICVLEDDKLENITFIYDYELLHAISSKLIQKPKVRVLFVADSCFSENVLSLPYTYLPNSTLNDVIVKTKETQQPIYGNVYMISGSLSTQPSLDVRVPQYNLFHGALTHTLLKYLDKNRTRIFSYREFILETNQQLKQSGFSQVSCFSSSSPLTLDTEFSFP